MQGEPDGAPSLRTNRYLSPVSGWRGNLENRLANATALRRLRRFILSRLPFLRLASDVRDIVYMNWVVPVAKLAPLVPPDVPVLARNGQSILTLLTYRHGHFGPALAGPLRTFFPSPLQSNWRLYVDPQGGWGQGTVLFIRNIFDSPLYAIGTRLFSDILPSHRAAHFIHDCTGTLRRTAIEGAGSAPTMRLEGRSAATGHLPDEFRPFFDTWADAIRFLALQHRAIAQVEDEGRLAISDIALPIDPSLAQAISPTAWDVGPWLKASGVDGAPFCFYVPSVHFQALSERLED